MTTSTQIQQDIETRVAGWVQTYADDEFANQDDLIGGLPVEDRINSINDKITTVLGFHI